MLAKQAGEAQDWSWVEPSVWNQRMLTALEQGVQGGQWFSLIDKVYSRRNLSAALKQVVSNRGAAGVDHVSVQQFFSHSQQNLDHLAEQLRQGTYQPQSIRRVYIPKPGSTEQRPLGIPTVRDRVAQTALVHVLEPIFEWEFAECSYGFRPQRGCQQTLARVEHLLEAGYCHVVDADVKNYYGDIPHDPLMQRIREKVSDGRVLKLIESFLKAGILEGTQEWTPVAGAPQGAVLSPLLSNIYLNPLDQLLLANGFEMVRYADDFVILCRSREEAERALAMVQTWMSENGLTLHPEKTRIADSRTEAFEFLGYRYERGERYVRKKSLVKLKERVREKTRRTDGRSLAKIIGDLNRTLRGWYAYFQRSRPGVFGDLDSWIRRRLRSLLRRRLGMRGMSRHGADEQKRWPVAWFGIQGLFSLKAAHESSVNPL